MLVGSLDPRPAEPTAGTPHPISVRHPFRRDPSGNRALHGREPCYPVCGCGWVGRPQDSERRGWDLAWGHARIDWRSVPVQPEPRAAHRPRRARGQAPAELPPGYRGPIPCHFGLADKNGCGKAFLLDQRDGVTSYHGCRGVIPPEPWRAAGLDRHGTTAAAAAAARGEVCVCPCHLVADEDALPRRCWRCGALMRVGWPAYRLCPSCDAELQRQRTGPRRPSAPTN